MLTYSRPHVLKSKVLLTEIRSLDPDEDILVRWLSDIGFWGVEIELRVGGAKMHLPLDIETRLREKFDLPLKDPTRTLLTMLLQNENGIELKTLGLDASTYKDTETCVGKLNRLRLIRVQDGQLLKPDNAVAFEPRIQYLIGLRSTLPG